MKMAANSHHAARLHQEVLSGYALMPSDVRGEITCADEPARSLPSETLNKLLRYYMAHLDQVGICAADIPAMPLALQVLIPEGDSCILYPRRVIPIS